MDADSTRIGPLTLDTQGVYRVGSSRVTLDLVIHAFDRGATAEEIVQDYPILKLPDVHQVIGYYLKHGQELRGYLQRRASEQDEMRSSHPEWSPVGLRARLLSRKERR